MKKNTSKKVIFTLALCLFFTAIDFCVAAAVQQPAPTITNYTYDPLGQRITVSNGSTTTVYPTKFYNLQSNIQNPTPNTQVVTKHISANGTDAATIQGSGADAKVYYNHGDLLNSSNVLTDQVGTVAETLDYFPFGGIRIDQKIGDFNEQRKYIGQEFDADTGLNYLNARYYNATSARFISQDPLLLAMGDASWIKSLTGKSQQEILADPQNLNSYAYARNNPIVLSDPDGKDAVIKFNEKAKTIAIQSTIYIHGSGATSEVANRMQKDIMNEWNKGWTYMDQKTNVSYSVNFDIQVKTTKFPWLHGNSQKSNVIEVGGIDRSYVNADKAKSGVWRDNTPDPAPHEFGHLLGLDDRYIEGGGSQKGWEGNIMSEPAMQGRVEQKNIDTIIQPYAQQHDARWFPLWNQKTSHHIAPRNGDFK